MRVLVATNMYPTDERPMAGSFVHDQVEALRSAGAEIDLFFVNGPKSRWNYLWGFPRLWWRLARERYDLIHAHYVFTGIIARAQWGHRVALTHHGPEVLGHPRWQSWLCKLVTPWFDQVIYVSEETRLALRDDDGWVIPCGIDPSLFTVVPRDEARRQLGLPLETPMVLWAGDPSRPEKRFDLVKLSMELVKAKLPKAELLLLTGKSHDAVPLYMSACDVLVLTSAAEGSPMVIKEAMACNLPIVSVRAGDVPEVIGTTPGCAIAERTPSDIAGKLLTVLHERRRTDGRSRIGHLHHDRIAERLLAVYARTTSPNRKGRRHVQA